jgi:hypothetical protein
MDPAAASSPASQSAGCDAVGLLRLVVAAPPGAGWLRAGAATVWRGAGQG